MYTLLGGGKVVDVTYTHNLRGGKGHLLQKKRGGKAEIKSNPLDVEYRNLIFAFIDNVKPCPKKDKLKGVYQLL